MGTMIEWYDFYIFGSLAVVLSTKFFPTDNPTAAFLSTLATFAAGFVVRPFGALFFGRLGDLIGKKIYFHGYFDVNQGWSNFRNWMYSKLWNNRFCSTNFSINSSFTTRFSPWWRIWWGCNLWAEHAPAGQKGYWTSWIQTTATVGLFISVDGNLDYKKHLYLKKHLTIGVGEYRFGFLS